MAAVFKSILIAAAVLLVGFGAAGAVWAEPVSPNRVIPDPLVKHRPTYVDPFFSDAAIAARAASACAKESAGGSKRRRFWFKPSECLVERVKPEASTTYGKGPVVLEQVWLDEAKRAVPARLRRPTYISGYTPGVTVPSQPGVGFPGQGGQVGDFWAGMYRLTTPAEGQESQDKVSPRTGSGENAK